MDGYSNKKLNMKNQTNESMEDFELFKNFPNVFLTLVDLQKPITDDTCLKKLQDILKKKLTTVERVERSGADCFLQKIGADVNDIQDSVLVFAIAVTGILGAEELIFRNYKSVIDSIFSSIWKCGRMKNPCIATAVFEALSHFSEHSAGLVWMLSENFLDEAWTVLENGQSLFLIQKVTDFMILTYSGICKHCTQLLSMDVDSKKHMTAVLCKIECLLRKKTLSSSEANLTSSPIGCALSILKLICKSDRSTLEDVLCSQNLTDCLLETFHSSSRKIFSAALDVLDAFCLEDTFANSSLFSSILEIPHKMLIEGATWKSQKFCAKLLSSFTGLTVDQVQTLEEMLLFPLYAVLDRVPDNVQSAVDIRDRMMTSLTKSTMTQLVWHTIDCMAEINFKIVDKAELILDTMKGTLHHDTVDDLTLESHFPQLLINNRKVEQKILEYLQSFSADSEMDAKIFCSILNLLREPGTDSLTFSKCLDCLFPRLPSALCACEEQGRQLAETLTKCTCHFQWEIRDSTAEFMANVVESYHDNRSVMDWLSHNGLHIQVWQMVSDRESYVRATVISFTERALQSTIVWDGLCSHLQNSDGPVKDIIEILLSDSEAFPRRKVVHFMKSLFLHKNIVYKRMESELMVVMAKTMTDFDWEVKIKSLEFWECVIIQELKSLALPDSKSWDPSVPLSHLSRSKVFIHALDAVLSGADDYDQSVCARACKILQNTKQRIIIPDDCTCPKKSKLDQDECEEGPECENGFSKENDKDPVAKECALRRLYETEWQTLYEQYMTSSDGYSSNPLSLIQDILLQGKDVDNEDNVLDCY